MSLTFNFVRSSKFPYLPVFLVGVALRSIPELLVSWYPVGYETITSYAPIMTRFPEMSLSDVFAATFQAGPLFYVVMWFAAGLSGAHAFLLLKVAGPLLYGCLAVSFSVLLRRGLSFEWKMAFVASLILIFQVAALRISWDRFRNVLGLIFVFATLTALRSNNYRFKWPLVASLSILSALSREYIAVILFVAVLGYAFLGRKERFWSFVAITPALTIFAAMVYLSRLWSRYVSVGEYALGSHLWIVQDVLSIFAVCYLVLLPFVLNGFMRDRLLDPIVGLLLLGSFTVVVSPWFSVPGYQRWLMLLVFPFSVYAVMGFERFRLFDKSSFRKFVAILLVFMVIGVGYSSGAFSYVALPNSWVPTNLVQSSIGWDQVDDVKGVLRWLDENAVANSSILSEERFYGWTLIYLKRANDDIGVIPYGHNSSPTPALEKVLGDGVSWVYLIWYTEFSIEDFEIIHSQNSVSIFHYQTQDTSL